MRIAMPPLKERKTIDRLLSSFFREHRDADFTKAIGMVCRFFGMKPPKVTWFVRLGHGKLAGQCYENGEIHLIHPDQWRRHRKYNTEAQWKNAVYHELGHLYFYTQPEVKADEFAAQMEQGVR